MEFVTNTRHSPALGALLSIAAEDADNQGDMAKDDFSRINIRMTLYLVLQNSNSNPNPNPDPVPT